MTKLDSNFYTSTKSFSKIYNMQALLKISLEIFQKLENSQIFHNLTDDNEILRGKKDEKINEDLLNALDDNHQLALSPYQEVTYLKNFESTFIQNSNAFNQENVPLVRLTRDILSPQKYDVRVRPVIDHRKSLKIHLSMSLYQIIDVVCFLSIC